LQYHIYLALSPQYSSNLAQVLGLTSHESTQIQKAVALRILHPASVAEIWNHCSRVDLGFPGMLHLPSSIDIGLFREFADYMVFASNYELAYESELRLATRFLSSRAISPELLGTWLPDPSDPRGSELLTHIPAVATMPTFFTHLPAMSMRRPILASESHIDSGYSSPSEGDPVVDGGEGRHCSAFPTSHHTQNVMHQSMSGRPNGGHNGIGEAFHSDGAELTGYHMPMNLQPVLQAHSLRHPLALVTNTGEWTTPPSGRQSPTEISGPGFRRDMQPSTSIPVLMEPCKTVNDQRRNASLAQEADEPVSAAMEPGVQSSHKETTAMILSKEEQLLANTVSNKSQQHAINPAATDPVPSFLPDPGHLVLRIQDKDGLARIVRKRKAKPVDSLAQQESGQFLTFSTNKDPGKDERHKNALSRLSTTMSSFSRGLLAEGAPQSVGRMKDITLLGGRQDPVQPCRLVQKSEFVTLPEAKQKASGSEACPSPTKMPRLVPNTALTTPLRPPNSENIDIMHRYHSEAKYCYPPDAAHMRMSTVDNTPSKTGGSFSDTGTSRRTSSFIGMTEEADDLKPRYPKSPSYSPISENEGLEDFQALLRGPTTHKLGLQVPEFINETGSRFVSSPTSLDPSLKLGFQRRLALTPTTTQGSDKSRALNSSSNALSGLAADTTVAANSPSAGDGVTPSANEQQPKIKLHFKGLKGTPTGLPLSSTPDSEISPNPPQATRSTKKKPQPVEAKKPDTNDEKPGAKTEVLICNEAKKTGADASDAPEKTPQTASKRGRKRGPRGPYKKTREKLQAAQK
jgi:hypothetical protein